MNDEWWMWILDGGKEVHDIERMWVIGLFGWLVGWLDG